MQERMARSTAEDRDALQCPRCGADAADRNAGYCTCCGSSLGLGGRAANGERIALRMGAGLGQEIDARPEHALSPAQGAQRMSPTGQGFAAVHAHAEYVRWMQEEPSCIVHMLGYAVLAALGLLFTLLALTGNVHGKPGYDSGPAVAVVALFGIGMSAFGGWQLNCFLRAPFLQRVARVVDTRSRTTHTKRGWSTRHYATFEFEDGSREEFQVSADETRRPSQGECGVAITRYTALLAFHRAGFA
jgi:Protein of unknown function (DUF2500)